MKITHATAAQAKIRNIYHIDLETYHGDADGDSKITIKVAPENIKQVIAEIMLVQAQFHGRGGCRTMYDQMNYFGMTYEAYEANGDTHDGYWEWFDREGDYPYDYESGQQNYTLSSYKIWWYDDNGVKFKVTAEDDTGLLEEFKKMNEAFHLGSYAHWEDGTEGIDDMFAEYRASAIELVKKHI
jgi:hypothetical protein